MILNIIILCQDVFNSQYPEYRVVKYPKAGETNPTLNLYVRNVAETVNKEVIPPAKVSAWGEYIYTVVDWDTSKVLRCVVQIIFVIDLQMFVQCDLDEQDSERVSHIKLFRGGGRRILAVHRAVLSEPGEWLD